MYVDVLCKKSRLGIDLFRITLFLFRFFVCLARFAWSCVSFSLRFLFLSGDVDDSFGFRDSELRLNVLRVIDACGFQKCSRCCDGGSMILPSFRPKVSTDATVFKNGFSSRLRVSTIPCFRWLFEAAQMTWWPWSRDWHRSRVHLATSRCSEARRSCTCRG